MKDCEIANAKWNVAQLFAAQAERVPDKCALVFEEQGVSDKINFHELWKQAASVGAGLENEGLKRGDRVIVMVPMSIDLYVTLLAVIKIGAIAVFVDPWIPVRQIARFADFANPKAFVGVGKSHWLRLFKKRLRKVPISVTTGKVWLGFPAKTDLATLKQSVPDLTVTPVKPQDSALITFTSGSSGEPKGANRTHHFLRSQHTALAREFPYVETDVDMPMFPVFALNNLVTGITSVVPDMDFKNVGKVDGKRIAEQMVRHGVTTVTASPPLLDRVAGYLGSATVERPKLRRVLTGGAPVSDQQLTDWISSYDGANIVVAYGSTEAEPVAHIGAEDRIRLADEGIGYCTGAVSSLVKTMVIPIEKGPFNLGAGRLEDKALPVDEIGELIVSGEHVCRDYYQNELATAENKLRDSQKELWHRMGDTGYVDASGRFWLVGRVHSTIFRKGEMVHPQWLERQVKAVAAEIEQAAVVGFRGPKGNSQVAVIVYCRKGISRGDRKKLQRQIEDACAESGMACDRLLFSKSSLPVDPRHQSKIDYTKTKLLFRRKLGSH